MGYSPFAHLLLQSSIGFFSRGNKQMQAKQVVRLRGILDGMNVVAEECNVVFPVRIARNSKGRIQQQHYTERDAEEQRQRFEPRLRIGKVFFKNNCPNIREKNTETNGRNKQEAVAHHSRHTDNKVG